MTYTIGSYGVSNWFPEHGLELVAEQDREAFIALRPAGKVFRCVGVEGDWLLLQYADRIYKALPSVVKPIPPLAFEIGQEVVANGKKGSVAEVEWHFKTSSPIYYLTFDGRQSSKRYTEAELQRA